MTIARQVVPGRSYLITRRCTQRQHLLRPEKAMEQIYLYCLAEAAERYDIAVHGFVAMSNHQHLVVRDNRGNFPEFLAHLHKMMAKAVNALRGRWENLWATEQANAVHLVDPADCFDKLVYLLANPVADHLVERLSDWPGACSFGMHLSGRTKTISRPRVFFREHGTMPEHVTLRVERPNGFEALSDLEWVAKLESAVTRMEERARDERRRSGRRVVGRKAILRVRPSDAPKSIEPRRRLRPHVACKNVARRVAVLAELVRFRAVRREALRRFVEGERDVGFPDGTYRVRPLMLTRGEPPHALCA